MEESNFSLNGNVRYSGREREREREGEKEGGRNDLAGGSEGEREAQHAYGTSRELPKAAAMQFCEYAKLQHARYSDLQYSVALFFVVRFQILALLWVTAE